MAWIQVKVLEHHDLMMYTAVVTVVVVIVVRGLLLKLALKLILQKNLLKQSSLE